MRCLVLDIVRLTISFLEHRRWATWTGCWVGPDSKFEADRIIGEYFWLWCTAIVSLVLYVPLYISLRRNIDSEVIRKQWMQFRRRPNASAIANTRSHNDSQGTTIDESEYQVANNYPEREALVMLLSVSFCSMKPTVPTLSNLWEFIDTPSVMLRLFRLFPLGAGLDFHVHIIPFLPRQPLPSTPYLALAVWWTLSWSLKHALGCCFSAFL